MVISTDRIKQIITAGGTIKDIEFLIKSEEERLVAERKLSERKMLRERVADMDLKRKIRNSVLNLSTEEIKEIIFKACEDEIDAARSK